MYKLGKLGLRATYQAIQVHGIGMLSLDADWYDLIETMAEAEYALGEEEKRKPKVT